MTSKRTFNDGNSRACIIKDKKSNHINPVPTVLSLYSSDVPADQNILQMFPSPKDHQCAKKVMLGKTTPADVLTTIKSISPPPGNPSRPERAFMAMILDPRNLWVNSRVCKFDFTTSTSSHLPICARSDWRVEHKWGVNELFGSSRGAGRPFLLLQANPEKDISWPWIVVLSRKTRDLIHSPKPAYSRNPHSLLFLERQHGG